MVFDKLFKNYNEQNNMVNLVLHFRVQILRLKYFCLT